MKAYTLIGINGNAYSIMGYVRAAMDDANMTNDDIAAYVKDATSSDYNHLVAVSCEMIDRVNEILGLNDYDDEDEDYYMDEYSEEDEDLLKELHSCIDRVNNRYLD